MFAVDAKVLWGVKIEEDCVSLKGDLEKDPNLVWYMAREIQPQSMQSNKEGMKW